MSGVGVTHTHPSWRNFATVPLQSMPPDRYEITFTDVPVDARVTFRVKAAGDPGITIGTLDARDQANQPVAIEQTTPVEARPTPAELVLASSYPNPFANTTTVVFGLPRAASVKLVVFDIQGRAVRHLIDGTVSAGWARVMWDGRDDAGRGLQSGAYVIRLAAAERVVTRSVRLVR